MFDYKKKDESSTPSPLGPTEDMVLLGIAQRKTLVEMAEETGKTHGWMRDVSQKLERMGYIEIIPHKALGRKLTEAGKLYLEANGLLKKEVFGE